MKAGHLPEAYPAVQIGTASMPIVGENPTRKPKSITLLDEDQRFLPNKDNGKSLSRLDLASD